MIDIVLLLLLVVLAIGAIHTRDLLAATMLLGGYSLLMCIVWTRMNAVDVAFTESAVGAGISAVLLLGAISRTRRHEAVRPRPRTWARRRLPILAVAATAVLLLYGTRDMPKYGDPWSTANRHPDMAGRFVNPDKTYGDMGHHMPNVVTAVLAHYRGYDTMGETTVIFVAAMVVILLLRPLRRSYGPEARVHLPEADPPETRAADLDTAPPPGASGEAPA